MRYDRISSVHDRGVVAALVEHTHVHAQVVGNVNCAAHTALIRADDHKMVLVDLQVRRVAQNVFDKLIGGLYGFEAVQRDRVLHSRIVSVESDDILHSHIRQLLKRQSAVEGLAVGTLVLAALIEKRHNHIDAARFSAHSGDDALQILIVVVGGHAVLCAGHGVSQAGIAHIHHEI